MPKHLIKRITPDHKLIREHRHLRIFGRRLHDANLWHLNRRSASGGFAVGLFFAFVPLPFQMLFAAGAAIVLRVNLPLSVVLVWATNPITIPPLFYVAYLIGAWVLRRPATELEFELSIDYLGDGLGEVWAPLLLGSLLCGAFSAVVGYSVIRGLWRWRVVQHLRQRKARIARSSLARAVRNVSHSEHSTPS
jgi:uncharacterized protein (DUF2062 family)